MWVIVLIAVICIFIFVYYFGEGKNDLSSAQKEFKIYGLESGFVPQGICFSKTEKIFLISGYMKNKNLASRIYVISENGEFLKYVMVKSGEKIENGHFGGIATELGNVWVSTDARVLRIKLSDIKNAKSGEFVIKIDEFLPKNSASFIFVNSGILWVGEFYKLGKFNTESFHHIKVSGESFHAMCFGFKIDISETCAVQSEVPVKAISIPDLVQGMVVFDDKIFVSTSFGISKSNISVFKNILSRTANTCVFIQNKKIPLYVLGRREKLCTLTLPAMSEEVEIANDKLYVLFESACKKYRFFTRRKIKNVFSFFLNNIDNTDI